MKRGFSMKVPSKICRPVVFLLLCETDWTKPRSGQTQTMSTVYTRHTTVKTVKIVAKITTKKIIKILKILKKYELSLNSGVTKIKVLCHEVNESYIIMSHDHQSHDP